MKITGVALLQHILRLIDPVVAVLAIPSGLLLKLFRRAGAHRLPITRDLLRTIGVFPVVDHYFEPLFDARPIRTSLQERRKLPGIELNEAAQLQFLSSLTFSSELGQVGLGVPFHVSQSFGPGDAEFLYQFVRQLKPRRVVEVGCGTSTRIIAAALGANSTQDRIAAEHVCIEPFKVPWLEEMPGVTVIRDRAEVVARETFTKLERGDFLFIDSTHMIRPQGDVLTEYLQIAPSLRSGVFIHSHDIFTPYDYPSTWVCDEVKFWNEQYLLEALLTGTAYFRVVAALSFLARNHYEDLKKVCPLLEPGRQPGSFYFERL